MSTDWMHQVRAGDFLVPDPLWNQTERWPRQLAVPSEILSVRQAVAQHSLLFEVRTNSGESRFLSAGWFEPPAQPDLFA